VERQYEHVDSAGWCTHLLRSGQLVQSTAERQVVAGFLMSVRHAIGGPMCQVVAIGTHINRHMLVAGTV
jgi:hypothetical protein